MTELEHEQGIQARVAEIQRVTERMTQLERELAKARQHAATSSKPPSSDRVKAPKTPHKTDAEPPRNRGGQPGHPTHARVAFPPDMLAQTVAYTLTRGPPCGIELEDAEKAPKVIQPVEILDVPIPIEAHRGHA